ncbi:MAG: hypothetical protein IH585_19270 [Anaerolineaceae bacterium]|nr:hypothetical protein [Anaerolineaceae bacterium]
MHNSKGTTAGSYPVITNAILWGNTDGQIFNDPDSTARVTYSDIQDGLEGTGNIEVDPLFINAPSNLRLQTGSPAINSGTNIAVPWDIHDLDGDGITTTERLPFDIRWLNRIVDTVDMGAYEYGIIELPSITPIDDLTVLLGDGGPFDLGSFSDPGSFAGPWTVTVDWGDSSTSQYTLNETGSLGSQPHVYEAAGWYSVTIAVTGAGTGSAQFQIIVENPQPAISSLTPLAVQAAGSSDLSLTVYGSNFVSTSRLQWDGVAQETTFISANEIQAVIPVGLIETARTVEITVFNPEPGGGISIPWAFFVTETAVTVQDYNIANSTYPEVPVTLATENISVEAIGGTGTAVVAEFSNNPYDAMLLKSSGDFFGVYLSRDSSFQQVTITINNVHNGSNLAWWDGEKWVKVDSAGYEPGTNSISLEVTADTEPGILQLSGTDFGLFDGAPYSVSANPGDQIVQYSDGISPVTVEARDAGDGVMIANVDLPWLDISEANCAVDGGNTTCTWTLSGTTSVPAGSYVANVSIIDAVENQVSIPVSIEVLPEDAGITFHAGNPVALKVPDGSDLSGFFEMELRLRETYPDSTTDGSIPYPGDISLGQVSLKLVPVGPGGEVAGDCALIGVFDDGYDAFQRVVCSFDAVPVNTYLATASVQGGYYTGLAEDVLVVYDPSLGYTTGGGWFYWPGTEERTSIGFTMEYNKSGSNIKGNMLLIRHLADGSIYQVKSNALDGISLGVGVIDGETFGWASFSGKATYLEAGQEEAIGNHKFLIYVEDHNEPGSGVDQIWVEIYDKNNNLIAAMSMPRPATENTGPLQAGNIFVQH